MSGGPTTASTQRRELFDDEHEAFRDSFRTFLEREVIPAYPGWRREGIPRQLFGELAAHQFVAASVPERHGGAGIDDLRFGAVLLEEAMSANAAGLALMLLACNEIAVPLLVENAGEEEADRLTGLATGETLAAFASPAEPPRARRQGGSIVLDGSAAGVVNGGLAELILVTALAEGDDDPTLVVLDADSPGLSRAPAPELVGPTGCDRADLRFDGVEAEAVTGGDSLAAALARRVVVEQLGLAVMAVAGARRALGETLEYVHDRRAFGRPIAEFENTRFALAAVAAEIEATGAFVDACVREHGDGGLTPLRAAAAKLQASELFGRAVDWGVQLHGGYGYMLEYPIAHAFADARFLRLYGGSSERMKEIVASSIGL